MGKGKRVKRQEKGGSVPHCLSGGNAYTHAISLSSSHNVHPSKLALRSNIPQQDPIIASSLHRQQTNGFVDLSPERL